MSQEMTIKVRCAFITALFLVSLVAACDPQSAEPPAEPASIPTATPTNDVETYGVGSPVAPAISVELLLESLANGTYRGILDEPVTLTGGTYVGEPFVASGASRPTVTLLTEPVAYGDLNGDGQTDAAVILVGDTGGSGTFVYLAAVESRDGSPINVATILLGDRERVKSLAIDRGRLVATLLSHAADDPACCPSLEATRVFSLQNSEWIDNPD